MKQGRKIGKDVMIIWWDVKDNVTNLISGNGRRNGRKLDMDFFWNNDNNGADFWKKFKVSSSRFHK